MSEIMLITNYKKNKWNDSIKFEFEKDEQAVYALSFLEPLVFNKTFEFFGDLKPIDDYINNLIKEYKTIDNILSKIKNKELNLIFSKFKKEYKPFLESYFLRKLLEKLKIYAWIQDYNLKEKPKQGKGDSLEYEGFALFIKHNKYFAGKRMSIIKDTTDAEILQTVVSAYNTMFRKAFDFMDINHKEIEEEAKKITKGKKKGFNTLAELFKTNSKLSTDPYLLKCTLENLKMFPYVSIDSFNKVFSNFKIKKQKVKRK